MKSRTIIQIIIAISLIGNLSAKNFNAIKQEPKFKTIVTNDEEEYNNAVSVNISQFLIKELNEVSDTNMISLNVSDAGLRGEYVTKNDLSINLNYKIEDYFIIQLFDSNGSLKYFVATTSSKIDKLIDFSYYDKGSYQLKISSMSGKMSKSYGIEKL